MVAAPAQQQPLAAERRGSRWLNAEPNEDEVRDWFAGQPLHEELKEQHSRYVSGIVLIGATEKYKQTFVNANGGTFVREAERGVFVPYVKVDTRIAYFWDLVRALNDGPLIGDHVGVIAPVPVKVIEDTQSPYYNGHLPEGYFIYPVRNRDDSISRFIACVRRVAIYERESYLNGNMKTPLLQGIGTKQTPQAKQWADDNALMKAETGATGRALGMAGILVIGTGVATAEDMQEAAAGPSGAAAASSEGPTLPADLAAADVGAGVAEGAALPDDALSEKAARSVSGERTFANDEELRVHVAALSGEFERDYPEAWAVFKAWWRNDRKLGSLETVSGPVLRGAAQKLERDLDAAKQVDAAKEAVADAMRAMGGEPPDRPGSDAQ